MPTTNVIFTVLDVGQGTGNFLELYDENNVLTRTVLIDLGSEKAKGSAGGPSVDYIIGKLVVMSSPRIEAIFLSHSDSDHINLLEDVLDAFSPGTLTIGKVLYGGEYEKYSKRNRPNLLDRLVAYGAAVAPSPPEYSNYLTNPREPHLLVDGVDFYVLIGNATAVVGAKKKEKKKKRDSFAINTDSLIVVAEFAGQQYVTMGDATGKTIESANVALNAGALWGSPDPFPSVQMLTMPHHGSEATTFSLTGASGDREGDVAVTNVRTFADRVKAKTITSSAERVRRFKHPSAYLMRLFWPHLDATPRFVDPTLQSAGRHYYTAYFKPGDGFTLDTGLSQTAWPRAEWWYTAQTAANVYTNLYYLPPTSVTYESGRFIPVIPGGSTAPVPESPGPLGVAWQYRTNAAGQTDLRGRTNRAPAPPSPAPVLIRSLPPPAAFTSRIPSPPPFGARAPAAFARLRVIP